MLVRRWWYLPLGAALPQHDEGARGGGGSGADDSGGGVCVWRCVDVTVMWYVTGLLW